MGEGTGLAPKPLLFVGSSRRDLRSFPEDVRHVIGQALYEAQCGGRHVSAKPLKGFGGAAVLEIVEDAAGGTYRAGYTVQFRSAIYVLHAFQKKSKRGLKTPRNELDKIRRRLKDAATDHKERYESEGDKAAHPARP